MLVRLTKSQYYQRIKNSDFFPTLIHSQNYFLARIVTVGLSFISLPIFTRLFTQEDYGIVAVYNSYAGILVVLLSASVYTSVARYYYENKPDFDEFLGTTLLLTGITFSCTSLMFLLFYYEISSLINLPGLLPLFLIFSSLFTIFNVIYLQIIQAQKKSLESALISILNGFLSLILAVIFVLILDEDRYLGQIWAYLLIGLIFSIYFMGRILSSSKIAFKKEHVKYILLFSVPLIPYYLSNTILAFFDRIMINNAIDSAAAGIYSLGYNIAMFLTIVIEATQTALMPDYYKFLNDKQYSRLDALIKKIFSLIILAALGLILFTDDLFMILVDKKFHEGEVIVPIVVIGYIFYGMFTVYGRYFGYIKKTAYSSLVLILSGIFNIGLNAVLIPEYGFIAAAYSTVASYFLLFLMTWSIVKFKLRLKITPLWAVWKPVVILFCFLTIFYIVTTFITINLLTFAVKIVLVGVFCILVFFREIKVLLAMKN